MILFLALASLAGAPDSVVTKSPDSLRIPLPRVFHQPVLDGKLDDAIWREAAQLKDFVQGEPKDQAPPSERSVAYVAYDANYFYFAFRAFESDPDLIRSTVFPRERGGDGDDRITILLDTFLDRRRAFEFKSNPVGIQADGIKVEGQQGDLSPDFVWYSAGRRDEEGWVVEMMIPWASLRFPSTDPLSIGFNAVRIYGRSGERDAWAPRRKGNPCDICQQGVLTGIRGITRRRPIDIYPYLASSQLGARRFGSDSTFSEGKYFGTAPPLGFATARPHASIGADFRIALTSALVVNATLNPDFSQIEADDDQIRTNQRFTLFQPERRPFFLEGRDAVESGFVDEERSQLGSIFYSRSIVDPTAGIRVTSKLDSWTIAGLYAKDHTPAYFYYEGYESSGFVPIDRTPADVVVARVRRDLLSDSHAALSVFGRKLDGSSNSVAHSDFSLRRGPFIFTGEGALSSDRAPTRVSQSRHFNGAERDGKFYRLRLARSGRTLSYSVTAGGSDSLFRDQLGRFARVGVEQYTAKVLATRYANNRYLQRIEHSTTTKRANRFGGGLLDYNIDSRLSFHFQRQTSLSANAHFEQSTVLEKPIRVAGTFLEIQSDLVQRFGIGASAYIGGREIIDPSNPRPGKGYFGNIRATVRPVPQASIELRGQRSTHSNDWGKPLIDDAKILRLKGVYQFSREFGMRVIAERSDQFNSLITNPVNRRTARTALSGLATYELGPSSFLYFGYNEVEQDFSAPVVREERALKTASQLFFKLSYLFRL